MNKILKRLKKQAEDSLSNIINMFSIKENCLKIRQHAIFKHVYNIIPRVPEKKDTNKQSRLANMK